MVLTFSVFADFEFVDYTGDPFTRSVENVLRVMSEERVTLSQFLLYFFDTEKPDTGRIRQKRINFYKAGTHVLLLKRWRLYPHIDDGDGLLQVATQMVADRMRSEFDALSKNQALHLSSVSVRQNDLDKFALKTFSDHLVKHSPHSFQVLNQLTGNGKSLLALQMITSIILFRRNLRCNLLQQTLGIYLYQEGCPRKVVEVMSHAGLSVSYTSILVSLRTLSNDSLSRARYAAFRLQWMILYDNINIRFQKYDQRINNNDTFESGTTATIVIGDDPGPMRDPEDFYYRLRFRDLIPDEASCVVLNDARKYHFIDVLTRHHKKTFQYCSDPKPAIDVLEPAKTETYPLPAMHIDQSTVEGNKQIIDRVRQQLQLNRDDFTEDQKHFIAGDQLTVSRIRTAKRMLAGDETVFDELKWAVPVIQLFHLQMMFAKTILSTHYGSPDTGGSLAQIIDLLKRKRVGVKNHDFHSVDELIRHTLDGMILHIWQLEYGVGNLDEMAEGRTKASLRSQVRITIDNILERYLDPTALGDMQRVANRNACLFIRDALLYIDLSDAIRSGDIGRIEESLKWVTICVQSSSTRNYANELLHLHCGIRHAWTVKAKRAFMSSWLVNTTGKKNRWLPADLYQEHCNLLVKVIHAAKGCNSSWEFLAECVSPNIEVFSQVANKIHREFLVTHNSTHHHRHAAAGDIDRIVRSLQEYKIFESGSGPQLNKEESPVVDLLKTGIENLESERVARFKEKSSKSQFKQDEEDQGEAAGPHFDRDTYRQYVGDAESILDI